MSHLGNHSNSAKSSKDLDNQANTNRQYRDKQKTRQQQLFAHANQSEYQEFMQIKDSAKNRGRGDIRDRKHGQDVDKRAQGQMYASPQYKSDKTSQQYHILVGQLVINIYFVQFNIHFDDSCSLKQGNCFVLSNYGCKTICPCKSWNTLFLEFSGYVYGINKLFKFAQSNLNNYKL